MLPEQPNCKKRKFVYVLEASEKTKEAAGEMEGSFHRVTLETMITALKRFNKSSDITIYTNDEFVKSSIQLNMDKWVANGFTRSQGKPLANQEQWQQLHVEMQKHDHIEVKSEEHSFTKWMRERLAEIEKTDN